LPRKNPSPHQNSPHQEESYRRRRPVREPFQSRHHVAQALGPPQPPSLASRNSYRPPWWPTFAPLPQQSNIVDSSCSHPAW